MNDVGHGAESDVLARALYEQRGRQNLSDGTASFYPAPWGDLPEESRDYWREQGDEIARVFSPMSESLPSVERDAPVREVSDLPPFKELRVFRDPRVPAPLVICRVCGVAILDTYALVHRNRCPIPPGEQS